MTSTTDLPKEPITRKKIFNPNLISLKCLLFLFFGGMGCLFPFLPLHMTEVGLTRNKIGIVSMASAVVAILGPLIAGPLADKMAGHQGSNDKSSTGRYLRVMIAVVCVFSALFYSLLLLVPATKIELSQERSPSLNFSCDQNGAIVYQERCKDTKDCHRWIEERLGTIVLTKCQYVCHSKKLKTSYRQFSHSSDSNTEYSLDDGSGDITVAPLIVPESLLQEQYDKKSLLSVNMDRTPPHICYKNAEEGKLCHAFTNNTERIAVNATLGQPTNTEEVDEWCAYPVSDYFSCRIPSSLQTMEINKSCSVQCKLENPYTTPGNVLEESLCGQIIGNPQLTFWMYLVIRSVADIFPTAAVVLLDAAVVIATRETSCGRGDVGRQLAFGSLGFALFGPLTGYLTTIVPKSSVYYLPIVLHCLMVLLAACVALSANGMPLSPPEWWWQTRCGMLALPMSAVKRYGSETAALVFVLIIMGIFWSAMDTYLPLYLTQLNGDELSIGIVLTVGALPTLLFLWKSEHLVDYCGHSNLFILAFTIYIVRFTGLSLVPDPWWALISEALELFTLGIMWVTAILYLRHLVPRNMTVTAQALPVIAHFCIGRALGAVIGAYVDINETNIVESLKYVYRCMAGSAAIIAIIYFILYHGLLKPKCHAQNVQGTRQQPSVVQAMNGNGSYTPLRVYHNGMAKKGEFRY
ncbi:uncharacterized protein LOC127291081 isoform X2 [Leptopilina boulardi]|uniref:uncharacterized protein LOC127291081 isoform X2 n=1 Tax=Leptopilina boulardi TaxID=63433 RepID=UPI0021F61D9C|nr:uncharacterized protein LOC127291081 isoform X2 [Leptopilina boulardi]